MVDLDYYLDAKIAQFERDIHSVEGFGCWQYLNVHQWDRLLDVSDTFKDKALEYAPGAIVFYSRNHELFTKDAFSDFTLQDWLYALEYDSFFGEFFSQWEYLNNSDWVNLIDKQPSLLKYCEIEKYRFETYEWEFLLSKIPTLIARCSIINKLDGDFLKNFILKNKTPIKNFSSWECFSARNWVGFIKHNSDFIEKAKQYPNGWAGILYLFPEREAECSPEMFEKFSSDDWVFLASKHKQFLNRCPFVKFTMRNWADLIIVYPELAKRCNYLNDLNDYDKLKLIQSHPILLEHFADCFSELKSRAHKYHKLKQGSETDEDKLSKVWW